MQTFAINILQHALSHTGFTDIEYERLNVTFEFATVEDYINYTKAVAAPIESLLSKVPHKYELALFTMSFTERCY